jgi:hypothetical protein
MSTPTSPRRHQFYALPPSNVLTFIVGDPSQDVFCLKIKTFQLATARAAL